jgi:hypothetical protein
MSHPRTAQWASGKGALVRTPVAVTHPFIIRDYMTIPKASRLVLQAAAAMNFIATPATWGVHALGNFAMAER